MLPRLSLFETLKGSSAPDDISSEPIDGFLKFKWHLQA